MMLRRQKPRNHHYSEPDHRPMIPVFRKPNDSIDTAVRVVRQRYEELNPDEPMKWR